ncbi:DUF4179 domain-containing protein [Paenibacillus terrigena]|uniref:DUF4179 domain-containing protein n=1 Tax=Paenibacillus terrigena TaxID=369333 RepID=UPI00036BAE95|nr:DUF4179 domain-containing protein [Paenibacillus terrigena]
MNNPIRQSKSCHEEGTIDMVAFKQRLVERVRAEGGRRGVGHWSTRRKMILTTLTAVVLSGCIMVSSFPSIASWFSTLTDPTLLDSGVTSAAKEGYSVNVDASVSDNNITLHIVDVLADSTQLVVSYYVERDGGRFADYLHGDLSVMDATSRTLTNRFSKWQRDVQSEYGYLTFDLPESPQKLTLQLHINKIQIPATGNKSYQYLYGKWDIRIPIDISDSKSATKHVAIPQNTDFTIPQGDSFALQQITFSPSMTRFEFDGTTQRILSIDYIIKDGDGNIILLYNANSKHNNMLSYAPQPQQQAKIHSNKYFISMDPLQQGREYAFQANGIWIVEPVHFAFPIDRGALQQKPLEKKYEETTFQVKRFALEKDPDNQKAYTAKLQVHADRITHPYIGLRKWELVDDEGNHYLMDAHPETPLGLRQTGEDGFYELNQSIVFRNLPKDSNTKQFTLVLSSFPHYYKLNWSIPFTVPTK